MNNIYYDELTGYFYIEGFDMPFVSDEEAREYCEEECVECE